MQHLGRVSWVRYVQHRSCRTPNIGSLGIVIILIYTWYLVINLQHRNTTVVVNRDLSGVCNRFLERFFTRTHILQYVDFSVFTNINSVPRQVKNVLVTLRFRPRALLVFPPGTRLPSSTSRRTFRASFFDYLRNTFSFSRKSTPSSAQLTQTKSHTN